MAVVVNDPSNPDTATPVQSAPTQSRPDATPTSGNGVTYKNATVVQNGDDVKVKGSAEADRVSTKDLLRDSDHVINLGAGDDVFIFRADDATNSKLRNAVVDMGTGSNDHVVLANEISDYQITFRENGSIKFEYVGNGQTDNAAITFNGAEQFTFRNISDDGMTFRESQTFTYAELMKELGVTFDHMM
ncbi:hypothetical protein ACLNGM_02435 [Aureimonas phyllosphaerae]|uniref:hypothetical protein n=1 Tax=Aureimonas phyllosphaerae TaxID=1166078 RepID=UPI003A5C527C